MQVEGEQVMYLKKLIFLFFVTLTFSFGGSVLYSLDFTKQKDGDAKAWLRSKGFEFMLDADDLAMKFSGGKLVITTKDKLAGMIGLRLPKGKYLKNIGSVKIEWGVKKFPNGADWANGNNRIAIGAMFALGTEKLSSGLPFGINAAPYFLGPFIGEREVVGKTYLGKLYKEGGRYYCVSNKSGDSTIVTHFNINQKFQQAFKKTTPPLTAFAFQMNTKNTTGGAQAYIKRVTFYSK
jgi:hypothetical protein